MEAPKEIYLNYYGESAMWNERIESCDKAVKYIRSDKAVDRDALMEYLEDMLGHLSADLITDHIARLTIQTVIDIIDNL